MLHRVDDEYDRQLSQLGFKLKPSDYWIRQGYSTFQHEFVTNEMVSLIGENNIIWGLRLSSPRRRLAGLSTGNQRELGSTERDVPTEDRL